MKNILISYYFKVSATNTKPESSLGKDKPSTWSRRLLKTWNVVLTVRIRRSSSTHNAWLTKRPNKEPASRRCLKPPQPSTWFNSAPSSFQYSEPPQPTQRSLLWRLTTRNALKRRSKKCWGNSTNGGSCGSQNSLSITAADSSARLSSSPQSSIWTTNGDSAQPISDHASSTARFMNRNIKTMLILFRINKK